MRSGMLIPGCPCSKQWMVGPQTCSRMDRSMLENPWIKLSFDTWTLGIEAASVVALRMLKIGAGGPAGAAEARRMVTEKIEIRVCSPGHGLERQISRNGSRRREENSRPLPPQGTRKHTTAGKWRTAGRFGSYAGSLTSVWLHHRKQRGRPCRVDHRRDHSGLAYCCRRDGATAGWAPRGPRENAQRKSIETAFDCIDLPDRGHTGGRRLRDPPRARSRT